MGKKKTYLVDGNPVIVEDKDNEAFLKEVPNAQEAKAFLVGNDSVAVAPQDLDAFLKEVPDAKPLFEDEEVKKKGSASSGSGIPTDGKKNPYAPNTEIDYSSLQDKKSPGPSILSDAKNSATDSPFVQSLKPKVSAVKNLQDSAAKAAEQERLEAEKERKASVLVNQIKKEPTPAGYKPDDVGMEAYANADKSYMAEQNAKIDAFVQPKLAELQKQYSDEREQDPKYIEAMAPIKQQIDAYSQELIAKAQKVVVDNHITDKAKLDEMNGQINKAVNEYAQKLNDESPEIKKVNGYYNDKIKSDIDEYIKKEYKPKTKYFGNGEPIEPFISAIKSESFGILSQNEKKTIIASMWDKINTRLEQKGTSPKTIAEAKQEFMWYALSAATHNENGGISQFALREMATKMKVALEEEYKNTEDERKLLQEHTKDLVNANSMSKEDRAIYDKTTKIENSIKNIDAVLSTPDGDISAWLAFGKGFASEAGLPFIKSLNEISTGIDTYKISQKILKKQPLTPEEATYMKTVGMADAIRSEMPNSSSYNIGAGLAGSIVFLGEFAALNPVGAAVEEGSANALRLGLKSAGNKVKQAAYKEAIATQLAQAPIKFTKPLLYEALVVKPLSTLIGATAQTLASPNQVINNTIRRMTPQALVMFSPEVNDLVTQLNTDKFNILGYRTGHNEPMSEALPRGFAQAFTEIFTEKMFTGLSGVSDLATRGLMTRLAKDIPTAQKMYVAYMMSKYKLRVDQVDEFLKNSGLPVGGSIEEFGEEIGSGLLTPWLTGDGKPLGDWYDSEKGLNWKTIGETGGVIIGQSLLFRTLGAAATMGKGGYVDLRVTDGQTTFTSPISQKGFEFIDSSLKGKNKEYIKAWAATHITSFSEKEQLAVKALINHLAKEKIFQTHKGKMVPDIYGVNQQQAPPNTPPPNTPPPTPEQQAAEDFDTKERKRGNTGYTIQNQDGTIETPDEQELLEWLAVPANLRALEQGQSTLQADNPSDEVSAVLVEFAKHGSAIATPDGAVTAEKHNGKYVKYKGELGIIHVDEGGKITVETPDKIYDIQGNATDDLAEHGIEPINARPAGSATQAPPAAPVPAAPAGHAAGGDEAISTDAERLRGTTTGETLAAEFANEQDPYDAMSRAYHQALGIPINKRTKAQHRLIAGVEEAFAEKDKAPDPPSDKIEPNVVNDEDGYNISAFKVGDIIERDGKRYEILGNSKKENRGIVKLRSLDSGVVSDWNTENNGGFKLAKEDKPSGEKPQIDKSKWNESEHEAWDNMLSKGKGLVVAKKSDRGNYKNLIDEGLVYLDTFGSGDTGTLRLTEKGEEAIKATSDNEKPPTVEDVENENNAEDDKEVGDGAVGNYNPKFKTATKIQGEATTIEMPNGETREAEYMVVESDDILASHNEISFNDTEGFPKTKDGRNANSRNYKGDKSAQLKVNDDAANLKSSIVISDAATPDTGVPIISEDGIVLSGNGRTMAIKLSQNIAPEKYQAYKADLLKRAAKFGIDPSEVAKMKKPILVKVDKSVKDYSVKTFDEYNGKSQKEESPIDKAIKRSAIIQNDENLKERILSVIGRHETMTDLFENKSDRKELFDLLVANNIILKQETPKYVQQSGEFTNDGKDLINDVLIATILSPETLEATNNVKAFRNKIINALPVLSVNYKLGSNSLEAEVNDAIMLQSRIAAMGSQDDFWKHLRQMGMFDAVNPNTVIINRMINNGAKDFKKFIVTYNKSMEVDEHNLFGGDVVLTKQQVIDNLKESNLSENEQQIIANLEELYNANEQKGPIGNDEVVGGNEEQDDKGEADKPFVQKPNERVKGSTYVHTATDSKGHDLYIAKDMNTTYPYMVIDRGNKNFIQDLRNNSEFPEFNRYGQEGNGPNFNPPPAPPREKRKIERKIRDAKDQKDIDDALDDLFKPTGPKLTMNGIDPDKLAKAIKVVGMYLKKGVHKFSDIIEDAYAKYGDAVSEIFDALKAAYLAYLNVQATDAEAAQMDTNLRGVTLDSIINTDNNDDNRPGDSGADSSNPKDAKPDNEEIVPGKGGKGAGGRGGNSNGGKESKGGKGSSDIRPPSSGEQGDNEVDKPDGGGKDAGNDAGNSNGRGNDITSGGRPGAAKPGGKDTSGGRGKTLSEKVAEQKAAEGIEVVTSDIDNIRETLPFLLPEQQEDVKKAEDRFFGEQHKTSEQANGKGILFTNGTGTGKTYTGLGIIKRFVARGAKKVLIVVPSSMKSNDWKEDGKNLGLDIHILGDTKDAGKQVSVTTYANFRANEAIMTNDYDLVVYDESHRLLEEKTGKASSTSYTHYEIANKSVSYAVSRLKSVNPLWIRRRDVHAKIREINKSRNNLDLMKVEFDRLGMQLDALEAELETLNDKIDEATPALEARAKKAYEATKVVFLSATPFKFHFNLRYVNGFLFDWGNETIANNRGSRVDPESRFYLEHFGSAYEWKYHRLQTKPLANPDAIAMQEVAFADNLMKDGAMSGRAIDSPMDYSREFPIVSGFNAEDFNRAFGEIFSYENRQFDALAASARKVFLNYNYTAQLFESLKTSAAISRIQQHLDLGRKVVVFHRRQQANATPPFRTIIDSTRMHAHIVLADDKVIGHEKEKARIALQQADAFEAKYQDLLAYEQTLNYDSAVEQITRAFPGQTKIINGNISGKNKNEALQDFNKDGGKTNILVVQEEAGKEGISLHDTTGVNPRVLMSMSMPISTTTALQVEGRIFRIGQKSNAIFEYPLLGLDLEIAYFGNNLNKRLSTTENLALGTNSRDLIRSYSEGVLNNSSADAPHIGQGVGGKEYDKKTQEQLTPFGKAKLIYATNQKTTGTRNQRQGVDFYPTPEPLGQKMVEWADMRNGEHALEPSAGMGAIAMWVPNTNSITAIEPSFDLYSKLTARAGGSTQRVINGNFEDHAAQNKYETIVMNPPFGQAGSTAMQHVKKAFSHLREGGRMVAIVPVGNMDKLMANWLNETDDKGNLVNGNAKFVATIQLPSSTFSQAGTSINTRVVIIDKVKGGNNNIQSEDGRTDLAELADSNIDLRGAKNIGELFDSIENLSMPARTVPDVSQQAPIENNEEAPKPNEDDVVSGVTEYKHTVTGAILYKVTTLGRMGDAWKGVNQSAVAHKGKYSPFAKGWLFTNKSDAEAFVAKQNGSPAMGAGGTNQNIHAQDYAGKRMEAKTAYEKELEQALEGLSKAYAEARGNDAALKKLTENTPKTVRAFIKRLTQGTTPESVAESKAALVEIQRMYAKEKAEMRAGIPRERGTNFIIEKLSRAARNGDIAQETADLAIDLLRMSPEMFEDLAISITQKNDGNEGGQGWYRSADALVKIFKNPTDPTTAAHELLHHTERFMPSSVRAGIVAEWQNEVNLQIDYYKGLLSKETDAKKRDFYSKALMYLALAQERSVERNYQNEEDMKSIMIKYLSDHTDSQGNFHQGLGQSFYQLLDASEWWAVNASRLMQEAKNKPELKTWIDKAKAFLNGLIKAAKKIFKGSPTQAVEDGIKAIMDGRMLENREGGMLADSAHKIGAYAKGTNSNMSAQSGNGGVGGDVEMVNGFYTPSKNTQSSKMQSSGLPTGKFIALDAPFTSTVHDAKDAQKIQVNLKGKKVYNPDGVKGFKPTENLGKELSVFANEKIKEGKKSFEELMTEFYQSKGYDAYVRLIDGGMRNNERELILFDRNTPLTKQEQSLPTQEQTPEQQMADAKAELKRAWNASGLKYDKNAGQNLGFMYDPAVDIKRQGDLFKALYNVAKLAIQQAANKLLAINASDFIASIRGYGKLYADITDAHLTDVFNEAKKAFDAKEKDQSLVDPQMSQRTPNRAALAHDLVERVKTIYAKFGVPIAEQKLKKVRGFFQTHPEIVKISSMFNVAVGAHELMHYIIKKNAMVNKALSGSTVVSNQLKEIYVNHYPGAKDTHAEELQIEEGMTMLVNLWVQNPVYAQQMYGDAYYAMFDPAGSLYNNDVHDMALDFAEIIEDFLGLPANERIGARIRWGQPGEKKRSLHRNAYNAMKYQIYDKLYLAKDVDRMLGNEFRGSGIAPNIAMMNTAKTRMQHWYVRSRLANTRPQTPGRDGNWKEARYNTTVSDYMDLFHDKKSGLTIEEFNQMLVARRQLSDYKRLDKIDADVAAAKKMIETLEIDNTALEAQIAVETDKAILQSLKVQLSANLQNIDNYIKNIAELTEDALKTSEILERNRMSRPFAEEVMGLLEKKYAEPARLFDEVQANVVDMMEATGMVSAERANEWRGKDGYASFRRYLDDEEKLRESLVDAVGSNGVKQLTSLFPYKGSDLPLLPATYSQALAINEVMMKGTRNMMWQAWANAAANNKDVARMFRERTNSEGHRNDDIAVWVNGKKKFYQASAEVVLFANAIENIQPDKVEEVGRAIAKMLQVSVTGIYLPFALVNLSVDAATRFQLSETGAIPVVHDFKTIYHMLESPVKILVGQILGKEFDPNIIDEYISMGGKASLNINLHNISAEGVMKQFLAPTALDKAKLAADIGVEALSLAVNLTELMGRATEYRRAIAQGDPTNVAMMKAQNAAINWRQRGSFGNTKGGHSLVTKLLNTIAYSFAQVTAFNQVVAGAKRHPVKTASLVALITAVYAATQYLIYAWGDDDEKREMANQPVEMLPKFIYLPNSMLFGPGNSGLTKIRIPELLAFPGTHFALGARSAYLGGLKGANTTPKDVAYFSWKTEEQLVAGTLPPMMYPNPFVTKTGQDGRPQYPRMNTFGSSLIPTAVKTESEVINGMKTYPSEMPIIPNYMTSWQTKYQYDKYTTETAKYLASVLDWSPKMLDYYITQKTGRGVKMIIEVGEYALGKKDELNLYNPTQVDDRFFFSGELSNSFYDKANIAIHEKNIKKNDLTITEGDAVLYNLYTKGMKVLSQTAKAAMTKTDKQIDALQLYMDKMEGSPKLTQEERTKLKRGELTQAQKAAVYNVWVASYNDDMLALEKAIEALDALNYTDPLFEQKYEKQYYINASPEDIEKQ